MTDDREAALRAFDAARLEFAAAVHATPAAALRYRPSGEDYALGGLAVHVAEVLEKYERVLEAMHAAEPTQAVAEPPPPVSETDAVLVRDGFDDATRIAVLDRVRASHAALVDTLRARPEDAFRRPVPVIYLGAADPFPTSPADVLGWVHDHYTEHIHQVADLRSAWLATQH